VERQREKAEQRSEAKNILQAAISLKQRVKQAKKELAKEEGIKVELEGRIEEIMADEADKRLKLEQLQARNDQY